MAPTEAVVLALDPRATAPSLARLLGIARGALADVDESARWLAVRTRERDSWWGAAMDVLEDLALSPGRVKTATDAAAAQDAARRAFVSHALASDSLHRRQEFVLLVPLVLLFHPRVVFWSDSSRAELLNQSAVARVSDWSAARVHVPRTAAQLTDPWASPMPNGSAEVPFSTYLETARAAAEDSSRLAQLRAALAAVVAPPLGSALSISVRSPPRSPPRSPTRDAATNGGGGGGGGDGVAAVPIPAPLNLAARPSMVAADDSAAGAVAPTTTAPGITTKDAVLEPLLPLDLYLQLESRLDGVQERQIHRMMLFDAVNEALVELYPSLLMSDSNNSATGTAPAADAEEGLPPRPTRLTGRLGLPGDDDPDAWRTPSLHDIVRASKRLPSDATVLAKEVLTWMQRWDALDPCIPGTTWEDPTLWRGTPADRHVRVLQTDARELERVVDCSSDKVELAFEVADEIFEDLVNELVLEVATLAQAKVLAGVRGPSSSSSSTTAASSTMASASASASASLGGAHAHLLKI